MKFMVGYQLRSDDRLIDAIVRHQVHIHEVYFSWGDTPSGRNKTTQSESFLPWEAQQRQISDLERLSGEGISLNLLFNGNCYGRDSLSRAFFQAAGNTIEYIGARFGLASVTTTSPLLARFIKRNFKELEVRASVNMDIGTIQGMDYVSDCFDSFYMQRECNRNIAFIGQLKSWCDTNQKKLYLLANSGCLNDCSAHVFHDNLVAHESDIAQMDNISSFRGICWDYLKNIEKWISLLRDTSYIRPEDMHLYETWFPAAKLATRANADPVRVLEAYIQGSYAGCILDLCEPSHSGAIVPFILDNKRIPADFAEHVLACHKQCRACGYCREVFNNAMVDLSNFQ